MNTCTQRHESFKRKGMTHCPHCYKKLEKPYIAYDTKTHRFVRDGIVITEEQAREAWGETASHDWSLKAYNVMASLVMLHE